MAPVAEAPPTDDTTAGTYLGQMALVSALRPSPLNPRKRFDDGDVTVCLQAKQLLAVEVKAAGGRLRPEQAEFRELAIAAHVAHVVGGLDDVVAWLIAHGYLRDSHVPHYRVMPDTGERL